jgi:hypothetical protein
MKGVNLTRMGSKSHEKANKKPQAAKLGVFEKKAKVLA